MILYLRRNCSLMLWCFRMRKTKLVRLLTVCSGSLCVLWLTLAVSRSPAQQASTAPAATSGQSVDPRELLALAARLNGLAGNDMKPWHLKVDFTGFNPSSRKSDHETYEEFWVSPTKYLITETTSNFTQTEYGTEHGVFRSGGRSSQIGRSSLLEDLFFQPIPEELFDRSPVSLKMDETWKMNLRCLYAEPAGDISLQIAAPLVTALAESRSSASTNLTQAGDNAYCLDSEAPALRVIEASSATLIRNGISIFHGRYIANDIEERGFNNSRLFSAHVEVLEDLKAANDVDFTPPADAALFRSPIRVSGESAKDWVSKTVAPVYPPIARLGRVTGVVIADVEVGKSGHPSNVRIRSGPAMLQQATLDAIKRWVFKPYLLNGATVEFQTTVGVDFVLK